MSALLLAALVLGPAALAGPTDEAAVYELDPDAPETPPEAAEPEAPPPTIGERVVIPPPPGREAGAPPPDLTLPKLALPPPPPPPDGSGRLVGGSFAIVLGLGAASVVVVEGAREGGTPQFVAATFIPLGLASIGVGTYLLVRGAKARRNFNDWRIYTGSEAKPTGNGLLVGGTMSALIGGVTLVAGAVQAREPGAMQEPLAPTLFAVGATGLAVGVGGLTWGLLRRSRYRAWRQSTFLGSVTPTVTPLWGPGVIPGSTTGGVRGASFGLAWRG